MKKIIALFVLVLIASVALVAASVNLSKPTVVDVRLYSGSSIYTSGVSGKTVNVVCLRTGSTVATAISNSGGLARVTLPAGQCDLGDKVVVSTGSTTKVSTLIRTTSQINLIAFAFFNQ